MYKSSNPFKMSKCRYWTVDVFVTSKCIHLCILFLVTRCLFRDVYIIAPRGALQPSMGEIL